MINEFSPNCYVGLQEIWHSRLIIKFEIIIMVKKIRISPVNYTEWPRRQQFIAIWSFVCYRTSNFVETLSKIELFSCRHLQFESKNEHDSNEWFLNDIWRYCSLRSKGESRAGRSFRKSLNR